MIDKKWVIAHRGASFNGKENTLPAFKKAIEMKADMVEFDVRKTLDDKMIVFHDEKIKKENVRDLKYKEIKERLGYKPPLLNETLKYLKNKIKINVHLKERDYEIEALNLLLKYFKEKDIIISSEFSESLKIIKKKNSKIKTGFVIEVRYRNYIQIPFGFFPKKKILYSGADYVIPPRQILNKLFLIKAKKLNKNIIPWGINNKSLTKRLLDKDIIAGIITDRLDLMGNK